MNILFYLDPVIDNGNINFRWPTLKYYVPQLYKNIKNKIESSEIDLKIIISDSLANKVNSDEISTLSMPLISISKNKLAACFSSTANPANIWQQDKYTNEHVEHYKNTFLSVLGDFIPDVIIAYETAAPYFKEIYPNAVVLNETMGMFSRPPMPAFTTYDPIGTYSNSVLYKMQDELLKLKISADECKVMDEIRNLISEPFVKHDMCYQHVLSAKSDFRKVLLLPLQIDNYFSFTECSDYPNHIAMIEDIFENIPSDIGIIVTQHQDHLPVLDDAHIDNLKNRYRNFIYFEDLKHVPMLSSFLVNYVDGVITVSSAVGFHAALMKLPIFVLGNSHLSVLSSGKLNAIESTLESAIIDMDNVLYWILTHYQSFTDIEILSDSNLIKTINSFNSNNHDLSAFKRRFTDDQLINIFKSTLREKEIIDIFNEKNVKTNNNQIYHKITQAKAISYDLFDTLVERPFIEPHFLFQLIEQTVRRELNLSSFAFMRFRRMAEEAARRERGGKETTLSSIYRHFGKLSGLNIKQCKKIEEIEFNAELQVIQRREYMIESMKFAKKLGKVITIITDIYLEEEQIRQILEKVGIDLFDHLLVSATEDLRKHDGTIFPEYLSLIFKNYRISPNGVSILHFGDNGHADCDMAKPFNIRAHVIPKAIDTFKSSQWGRVFQANFNKRFMISDVLTGLIANRFDESLGYNNKNTLFGDSLFRVGYAAAGPMLFSFVQWLIRRIKINGHDKVYFVARDGYLLKLIYDQLRESGHYPDLPPSGYLYLSRRSAAVPSIYKWEDIVDLYHLSFGVRKIGDFIESRFGLPRNKINKNILSKFGYGLNDLIHQFNDVDKHLSLLSELSNDILLNAEEERTALLEYLKDNDIVTGKENCCMVDIGYSGSIQKYTNKILKSKIAGYYMLTHEAARRSFDDVIIEGFYNDFDEQRMADSHILNDYVFLFESVLSSPEGSVVRHRYNDLGEWSMDTKESNRELERIKFMNSVHAGVKEFSQDFINIIGQYIDDVPLGPYLGTKAFLHMAKYPQSRDALLFSGLKVENGFGGGDAWLLIDAKHLLTKSGVLEGKAKNIAIGSSQWKEAAHAAYINGTIAVAPLITSNAPVKQNNTIKVDTSPAPMLHAHANHTHNGSEANLSSIKIKDLNLPPILRKYMKYKKDPYNFFRDSKSPIIRPLRVLFRKYQHTNT